MLELVRVAVDEDGAFGVLVEDGQPRWVTLERTFEDNRVVIPEGRYRCTRTIFIKRGYPTYEIHVAGHSRVLFHKGNTEGDSRGCVLIGRRFGSLDGDPAILESGLGFDEFMDTRNGVQGFYLHVVHRKPHVDDGGVITA